ncbi:hypothetical protein NECAME_01851 [Necator americanus]|uniref:Uncharacterized protein n=1 Tax=Necator americanus TaxID=51031 RepID=W2TPW0_NECAM|nr:hypothetical protein NECAME_01851 [Necator americanus]ETN83052.1 hypothetical protein NECAME_01851 [Necator americanus]
MIGTDSDVTKVVSRLPSSVGDLCLYIDGKANTSLAYKLLESTHLSPKSTLFKYEAKDVKKRIAKTIDLVLYHWPSERLPKDFSELLRLMTLCNGRKVDHSRWCQIYDQMSAFSRRRANM